MELPMKHMTTAQADLLLRLADLLDEMESENIELSTWDDVEEGRMCIDLDGSTLYVPREGSLTGDDIRSITA